MTHALNARKPLLLALGIRDACGMIVAAYLKIGITELGDDGAVASTSFQITRGDDARVNCAARVRQGVQGQVSQLPRASDVLLVFQGLPVGDGNGFMLA